jgi:WD40 repeat protein
MGPASVVLWGPPPSWGLRGLRIIEVLPTCGVLVTVSDLGLVLWQLPTGTEVQGCAAATGTATAAGLRPYSLLLPPADLAPGRSSRAATISAVAECAPGADGAACIATVSTSGSVCVWHVSTGKCLKAGSGVIRFVATCVRTLPDRRYVLCAGQACDIELVDLQQMVVVQRLTGHSNWVEALVLQRSSSVPASSVPAHGQSSVSMSAFAVSVCRHGVMRFWDILHGGADDGYTVVRNASQRSHVLLPESDNERGAVRVVGLDVASNGNALLVVTRECARMFKCDDPSDPGALRCMGSFALRDSAAASPQRLAGGSFCCGNQPPWRIVLWTFDGQSALLEPCTNEAGVPVYTGDTAAGRSLLVISDVSAVARCELPLAVERDALYGGDVQTSASQGGRLLASASASGTVAVWAVAEFDWNSASRCTMWALGAVEDGWLEPSVSMEAGEEETVTAAGTVRGGRSNRQVTTSAVFAEEAWPLLTARGYSDGGVCVCQLPSDPDPIELYLHSAAVTEVQLVAQCTPSRLLLLSCSRDGSVCIFDVAQRAIISRSRDHSGAVVALHLPPLFSREDSTLPATRIFGSHLCSVGEDCCVCVHTLSADVACGVGCVHTLGGHLSPIIGVYWSSDDDSLFVRCMDGTLSIWLLQSGILERRLSPVNAAAVLEQIACNQQTAAAHTGQPGLLGPSLAPSSAVSASRQATVQSGTGVHGMLLPLHVLEFDVLMLVASIQSCKAVGPWWTSLPQQFAAALSYLYPWGLDSSLDKHLQSTLGLQAPASAAGLAVHGAATAFTAMFPAACGLASPMHRAVHLASSPALSLAILSAALLDVPGHQQFHDELIPLYMRKVLQQGDGAIAATEKLLVHCIRYWLHPLAETRCAAKGLFGEVVANLPQMQRRQLARHLSSSAQQTCVRFKRIMAREATFDQWSESASKCYSFFCLGQLAVYDASAIGAEDSRLLADELVTLALWRTSSDPDDPLWGWRNHAAQVLGDGFAVWRPHIPEPALLMRRLLQASFPSIAGQNEHNRNCALNALHQIGQLETGMFLEAVRVEALAQQGNAHAYEANIAALTELTKMIRRHPAVFLSSLDELASLVVSTLAPAVPELRRSCSQACKAVIGAMVRVYPMVSLHMATQRLAVGLAASCVVAIFDLNVSKRLLQLRGHTGPVSAVSFGLDPRGLHVASYSAVEGSIRCWHPSAGNGHCLCAVDTTFDETDHWGGVRMQWTSETSFDIVDAKGHGRVLQTVDLPERSSRDN